MYRSQFGYMPTGSTLAAMSSNNPSDRERGQNMAYMHGRQFDQEEHEKNLQRQEQQRRMYDSETARQSQQQKFGLLGGLLGGSRIQMGGR